MGARIVLDTNVLVAAVRSRLGASFRLLSLLGRPEPAFRIALSVPLVLEYEAVLLQHQQASGLTRRDIGDLLDYLCSIGEHHEIFYLWRPILGDASDDLVLEVAVAAGVDAIVTHNIRDFEAAGTFDLAVLRPQDFLANLGDSI